MYLSLPFFDIFLCFCLSFSLFVSLCISVRLSSSLSHTLSLSLPLSLSDKSLYPLCLSASPETDADYSSLHGLSGADTWLS